MENKTCFDCKYCEDYDHEVSVYWCLLDEEFVEPEQVACDKAIIEE